MILRLQGEKAAVKMEASQYKRMTEEKMYHAEESLSIFEDLIYQKELEIASLDFQVQAYRYKLLSLGVNDNAVDETKFPENLLQRNEGLLGDMGVQSIGRRNSMPPIPFKYSYNKKGIIERERSASPDMVPKVVEENMNQDPYSQSSDMEKKPEISAVGDICSYWEQIRKLDERVREIADYRGVKAANLKGGSRSSLLLSQVSTDMLVDSKKGASSTKRSGEIKHPENLLGNEATTDSSCSYSVYDVFEVPQTYDSEGYGWHTKEQSLSKLERSERLGKPDTAPQEAVKPYVNVETDWVKKVQFCSHHENKICRSSDGGAVDCHFALVRPTISVAETQAKFQPLNMMSEIIEVERPAVRGDANSRGEEELKLLKEIQDQLNSIQSDIRSWKTKKSPPANDLTLVSLTEAMLHFWL
ncbi:myosin-binding protein 7-like isoform X2 [Cornus florida]|nr:myosin-binding protein 7-like isoform X2 [Cornus florida]